MTVKGQTVANLKKALRELDIEQDAAMNRVRDDYQARKFVIQRAIEILNGDFERGPDDSRPAITQSIGEAKLKQIQQFIAEHLDGVRQADISRATGLNSGSVSVGVRLLHEQQLVQDAGKQDGSTVWKPVQVPARLAA